MADLSNSTVLPSGERPTLSYSEAMGAFEKIVDITEMIDCIVLACASLDPEHGNPIARIAHIATEKLYEVQEIVDLRVVACTEKSTG
ncbi:hypothetical protein [Mesorhizobium sp. A623]